MAIRPPLRRRRWLRPFALALAVCLLALALVYFLAPALLLSAEFARQARSAAVRERIVEAAGHRWVFYDGGRGAPIVLLHGFSGSKENWLPTARYLTDEYRVVIPDLAGWGETTRIEGDDYTVIAQVERVASFLDELGLRRVRLVGHSMGGQIAGVFAARYPDRVESLALVASAGVHFKENDFARKVLAGATPFNFTTRETFDEFMLELFVEPQYLPGRIKDVLIARNLASRKFQSQLLRQFSSEGGAFLLERELGHIKAPTTIVWCKGDRILDPSSTETFKAGLPGARIELLEACGHMPMMEQPKALAAALRGAPER